MLNGMPFTTLVTFEQGFPDAAVTWRVLKVDGTQSAAGSVMPPAGAVSVVIEVDGASNQLPAGALVSTRQLVWSYTTGGLVVSNSVPYQIEMLVPFGATKEGVRQILGLNESVIPNDQVDLVGAFGRFQSIVSATSLSAFLNDETFNGWVIRRAIEAQAGYDLVSSLQFRAARSESSGTDSLELNKPDYDMILARCSKLVLDGIQLVNSAADPSLSFGNIFAVATTASVDAITGQ